MLLKTTAERGILVAAIQIKEASLKNAEEFRLELITQINKGYHEIILNFKEVEYVDSSFLGALVSSLKYALLSKGDIVLTNLKQDIFDLLCLIRMNKVFKIYKTTEEALEKLTTNTAGLQL